MYANHFGLSNCDRWSYRAYRCRRKTLWVFVIVPFRLRILETISKAVISRPCLRCLLLFGAVNAPSTRYDRDVLIFDKNIRGNLNDRCHFEDYTAEMAAHFYGRFDERDRCCAVRVLPSRFIWHRVKTQTEARHTAESTSLRVASA